MSEPDKIFGLLTEKKEKDGYFVSNASFELIKTYIQSLNVQIIANTKNGGNKIEGYEQEIVRLTAHIAEHPDDFKAILELKRAKANVSSLKSRKNSLNKEGAETIPEIQNADVQQIPETKLGDAIALSEPAAIENKEQKIAKNKKKK